MQNGPRWLAYFRSVSFPGRKEAEPLTHLFLSSCGISPCGSVRKLSPKSPFFGSCGISPYDSVPLADDNSNQSSIADASPIKQENSSNSSPAPEPSSAVPGEGTDAKADEAQADGKELPGAEGMCLQGLSLHVVS